MVNMNFPTLNLKKSKPLKKVITIQIELLSYHHTILLRRNAMTNHFKQKCTNCIGDWTKR